MKIYSTERWW